MNRWVRLVLALWLASWRSPSGSVGVGTVLQAGALLNPGCHEILSTFHITRTGAGGSPSPLCESHRLKSVFAWSRNWDCFSHYEVGTRWHHCLVRIFYSSVCQRKASVDRRSRICSKHVWLSIFCLIFILNFKAKCWILRGSGGARIVDAVTGGTELGLQVKNGSWAGNTHWQ